MLLAAYVYLSVYPWMDLPANTVVCDVGGNNGHTMLELLRESPHLKVIVQDLESVQPLWNEVRSQAAYS